MVITSYDGLKENILIGMALPVIPELNNNFVISILLPFRNLYKLSSRFHVACPLPKLHRFVHNDS